MNQLYFEKAIKLIDQLNSEDVHKETVEGKEYSKELIYSQRMTAKLLEFEPEASEELQLASRAHHIGRWKIPRKDYPMDKIGYLRWREALKKMHAELASQLLEEAGYGNEFIERVSFLIQKKSIKKDPESQTIEDVICLVFLEHYFESFAVKHSEEKLIDIIKKTWRKMSEKGHEAALKLNFSASSLELIQKALS